MWLVLIACMGDGLMAVLETEEEVVFLMEIPWFYPRGLKFLMATVRVLDCKSPEFTSRRKHRG